MKIAYVITRGDAVGGASIHVRDLASAMRGRGHEVLVIVGGTGTVTEQFAREGVPYRVVPSLQRSIHPLKDIAAIQDVARVLREMGPDVVSTHTSKAGFIGRAAARRLDLPAIYTPHGWTIGDRLGRINGRVFRAVEKIAAPWSAAIVNVCEAERKLALAAGIGRPEQHRVIYNGVRDIPAELRAKPAEGSPRIISVARFEEPKDYRTLLTALRGLPYEVDLVGDGPLLSEMRHRAGPNVTFHGYVADPAPLLARAHLFVLSSRSEGFPRSILEAMRAGLPVVASDVGGVAEAVSPHTGALFSPGDASALREIVGKLMNSPEERQLLGEVGHHKFHERFRFGQTLSATEMLYNEVR